MTDGVNVTPAERAWPVDRGSMVREQSTHLSGCSDLPSAVTAVPAGASRPAGTSRQHRAPTPTPKETPPWLQ